ncbi:hypothetical protein [Nostoc sp.]|uniref:hypothetical protein n=1 Tax=Nostoc sp. TaxID=1180 RepID=UPI002FFCD440
MVLELAIAKEVITNNLNQFLLVLSVWRHYRIYLTGLAKKSKYRYKKSWVFSLSSLKNPAFFYILTRTR